MSSRFPELEERRNYAPMRTVRGYFGVGVESLSKPMNLGALQRTAHAFGASFTLTGAAAPRVRDLHNSGRSSADLHVPWDLWGGVEASRLPKGCELVGVELTDD